MGELLSDADAGGGGGWVLTGSSLELAFIS
jgi:hypothetical protein